MDRAARAIRCGQGQIERIARQLLGQRGPFECLLALGEGAADPLPQRVNLRPDDLALVRRQRTERLQKTRDRALLAKEFDPQLLQCTEFAGRADAGQCLLTCCCMVHEVESRSRLISVSAGFSHAALERKT